MLYNFLVKAEALREFVERDVSDSEIADLNSEFKQFRIMYDTEMSDDKKNLLNQLEYISYHQQILLYGEKSNDSREVLAYCFVGQDYGNGDKSWYEDGIRLLNKLKSEYIEC